VKKDKKTLTLSMIVKNETHIVMECLESVAPYIDYWVIADNGSTDGTQDLIKNFFKEKGIPGELHEVEWVDFGHNRTEALKLCDGKADYIFMIDADDKLVGKPNFDFSDEKDGYGMRIKRGDFTWWRNQIFKTGIGWKYTGILHEYADCQDKPNKDKDPLSLGRIAQPSNYFIDARTLGARNRKEDGTDLDAIEKYSKDAETLEEAIKKEPDNTRYQFYLAQSYFDSQQWEKAEEAYSKRAGMGGWLEEVYYSIFRVGMCKMLRKQPWQDCQDVFLQSWNIKPNRAEPLYHLARIHRNNGNPNLGYLFAKAGLGIPYPENDILFINDDVYRWLILDEFAATAFYVNDFEKGCAASQKLVDLVNQKKIPEQHKDRILSNLKHYEDALEKIKKQKEDAQKLNEVGLKQKEDQREKNIKNQENLKRKKQKAKKKKKKTKV